jgi:hypothetical protein
MCVAGAALVAGGVLAGLALAEDSAIAGGCFATGSCTSASTEGLFAVTLAADLSFGLAAASAIVGALLWILVRPERPRSGVAWLGGLGLGGGLP